MLKNYLRTTLRVLLRYRLYTFINLAGLSVGVAAAILLLLFVHNEESFDRGHTKADRIYRAWVLEDYGESQQFFNTLSPIPLGPALKDELPEVEAFARYDRLTATVRSGDVGFNETMFMVDNDFLSVFDFPLVSGDADRLFSSPEQVALTASAANRYFGNVDAIGKSLNIDFEDGERSFTVSAVFEDVPENSSLQFEMLLPYENADWLYPERLHTAWFNVSPETYVLLRPGVEMVGIEVKLADLVVKNVGDRVEPGQYTVGLQPLLDIHTDPAFPEGYSTVVNPVYIRMMLGIALLILAIACINFVTLSVSRSTARAREIGVRKAVGADRWQLVRQYWGEALIIAGLATGLGVLLARLFLPTFNALSSRHLPFTADGSMLAILVGLFLATGLVAGAYPALVLSGFNPHEALRGRTAGKISHSAVRKTLVVVQFSLAILLSACAVLMARQLAYVDQKDLGFNPESVVVLRTEYEMEKAETVADRLRLAAASYSDVVSVAVSSMVFDRDGWGRIGYNATDGTYKRFFMNVVDYDFIRTMGLHLVQGRDFDRNQPGDASRAIIVNQAFVDAYGWENPLEEHIPGDFDEHQIVGVVRNFNFESLHSRIEPAVLVLNQSLIFSGASDFDFDGSPAPKLSIRVQTANLSATLANLRVQVEDAAPDLPFSYSFLDDAIAEQYLQEKRLSDIIGIGTLMAIFTAGLGIFGLAAISVARRTKEIGLRKVLGAGLMSVVGLFLREFAVLIGAAFVLAAPFAYAGMGQWLKTFEYRLDIGVMPFLVAGAGALLVMALAVGSQSMRAALANPVDALRDE